MSGARGGTVRCARDGTTALRRPWSWVAFTYAVAAAFIAVGLAVLSTADDGGSTDPVGVAIGLFVLAFGAFFALGHGWAPKVSLGEETLVIRSAGTGVRTVRREEIGSVAVRVEPHDTVPRAVAAPVITTRDGQELVLRHHRRYLTAGSTTSQAVERDVRTLRRWLDGDGAPG